MSNIYRIPKQPQPQFILSQPQRVPITMALMQQPMNQQTQTHLGYTPVVYSTVQKGNSSQTMRTASTAYSIGDSQLIDYRSQSPLSHSTTSFAPLRSYSLFSPSAPGPQHTAVSSIISSSPGINRTKTQQSLHIRSSPPPQSHSLNHTAVSSLSLTSDEKTSRQAIFSSPSITDSLLSQQFGQSISDKDRSILEIASKYLVKDQRQRITTPVLSAAKHDINTHSPQQNSVMQPEKKDIPVNLHAYEEEEAPKRAANDVNLHSVNTNTLHHQAHTITPREFQLQVNNLPSPPSCNKKPPQLKQKKEIIPNFKQNEGYVSPIVSSLQLPNQLKMLLPTDTTNEFRRLFFDTGVLSIDQQIVGLERSWIAENEELSKRSPRVIDASMLNREPQQQENFKESARSSSSEPHLVEKGAIATTCRSISHVPDYEPLMLKPNQTALTSSQLSTFQLRQTPILIPLQPTQDFNLSSTSAAGFSIDSAVRTETMQAEQRVFADERRDFAPLTIEIKEQINSEQMGMQDMDQFFEYQPETTGQLTKPDDEDIEINDQSDGGEEAGEKEERYLDDRIVPQVTEDSDEIDDFDVWLAELEKRREAAPIESSSDGTEVLASVTTTALAAASSSCSSEIKEILSAQEYLHTITEVEEDELFGKMGVSQDEAPLSTNADQQVNQYIRVEAQDRQVEEKLKEEEQERYSSNDKDDIEVTGDHLTTDLLNKDTEEALSEEQLTTQSTQIEKEKRSSIASEKETHSGDESSVKTKSVAIKSDASSPPQSRLKQILWSIAMLVILILISTSFVLQFESFSIQLPSFLSTNAIDESLHLEGTADSQIQDYYVISQEQGEEPISCEQRLIQIEGQDEIQQIVASLIQDILDLSERNALENEMSDGVCQNYSFIQMDGDGDQQCQAPKK